jgi:hypothetical protein
MYTLSSSRQNDEVLPVLIISKRTKLLGWYGPCGCMMRLRGVSRKLLISSKFKIHHVHHDLQVWIGKNEPKAFHDSEKEDFESRRCTREA